MPPPDANLRVGSGSHAWQTAQIMLRFEPIVRQYEPDWVIVPGDVNSTLACALVCGKLAARVAHVEAGLRSFDRSMPEEINRLLTDQLADLLLTPSREASENLRREGFDEDRIHFVGNIMIDTLVRLLPKARRRWQDLGAWNQLAPFVLATLHRPRNVDDPGSLRDITLALNDLSESVPVVFPAHPRTRQRLDDLGVSLAERVYLTGPHGYLDFLALQIHAALVITDSGGVQEETTFLGVPCLTVRPNTERPVTVTCGTNRLVERGRAARVAAALRALDESKGCLDQEPSPPERWDGHTAERIVRVFDELVQ